jgi:hypothetical protein
MSFLDEAVSLLDASMRITFPNRAVSLSYVLDLQNHQKGPPLRQYHKQDKSAHSPN